VKARRDLELQRRLLAQVREQYAAVDADRLKFATQLSENSKLLDSRTRELRTAETFLTKYDDTPEDEVVAMVNGIDFQVLNIGDKVAEEITDVFQQNSTKDPDRRVNVDIANELHDVIGIKLVNILLKSDFTENPTPVQLAIQSMLVNGIYTALLTWPISPILPFGRDFWGLYKKHFEVRGPTCRLSLESIGIEALPTEFDQRLLRSRNHAVAHLENPHRRRRLHAEKRRRLSPARFCPHQRRAESQRHVAHCRGIRTEDS